ncbi:MAG: DUF58 domain-containing protein [Planctomycetes bacterium]|nr:DUF58 domain-containing protein [Planctomycetota bacterium]
MPRRPYTYLEPAALHRLGRLSLVARSVVEGFYAGLHRSPYRGSSVEFADHREYVPGDDLRHLDWKTLARTDRRTIKQYEEETNLRAHLLLDVSASMGYRHDANGLTKLEYASFLAACLSFLMIKQSDPVGLVLFDEGIQAFIPPATSAAHLNHILRRLEDIRPSRATHASAVFHQMAERIRRRGLVVILSDLFDEPREVLRGLQHFRYLKHEVILFHLFDRAELEFPFRQITQFVDLENGERIQIDPAYVRQQYLSEVQAFITEVRKHCLEAGMDHVQAHTGTPYDRMLQAYLSRRQQFSP